MSALNVLVEVLWLGESPRSYGSLAESRTRTQLTLSRGRRGSRAVVSLGRDFLGRSAHILGGSLIMEAPNHPCRAVLPAETQGHQVTDFIQPRGRRCRERD